MTTPTGARPLPPQELVERLFLLDGAQRWFIALVLYFWSPHRPAKDLRLFVDAANHVAQFWSWSRGERPPPGMGPDHPWVQLFEKARAPPQVALHAIDPDLVVEDLVDLAPCAVSGGLELLWCSRGDE